jgi:hypothetical protein
MSTAPQWDADAQAERMEQPAATSSRRALQASEDKQDQEPAEAGGANKHDKISRKRPITSEMH